MQGPYVLHIAKWYPNVYDDLEGIFIQRHIEAIYPHFNSVVFFAKVSTNNNFPELFITREDGSASSYTFRAYYKQHITGIALLDKGIKFILYLFLMHKFCRIAIKKFGPPFILHAHVLLRSAIIAYLFSLKLKRPYIITEHSTFFITGNNIQPFNLKNNIRRFLVKNASAVLTVSLNLEQGMKRFSLYNNHYYRIFNCVNTELFHYKEKSKKQTKHLLHVSEFKNEHKNVLGLLNVIKNLRDNNFQFLLNLVGYGQDIKNILSFIKDNNLADCVLFHGKLTDKQLSELYVSSDVFVLFSNKENMPCVIAEALCCGTPVISTNVGGIREVIHKGNGILIEKANEDQLYNAIIEVIESHKIFDNKKIADEAHQRFSNKSIGESIARVYQDCIATTQDG